MEYDGRDALERPGFTYLPRFLSADEGQALVDYYARLTPIWERRHADGGRGSARGGRLTRPVYWLGAWQFASLGYYAPPDHVDDKALRAEPFPEVMRGALARLAPHLEPHAPVGPFTSALINYYGDELHEGGPPVDLARLRPHRDSEPGPVVMLSVGQPARFELVDAPGAEPELALWLRHRSAVIFSGPHYKDRLYHQVSRVRHGQSPALSTTLPDFRLRRVSVSFRHVPEAHIRESLDELGPEAREIARPYVEELAARSTHFRALAAGKRAPPPPPSPEAPPR